MLLLALVAQVVVGEFTAEGTPPAPWRVVRIGTKVPPTRYRIARIDGVTGIEGVADRSMALLARPLSVDLATTPMLCWRWRIDTPVATADLRTKRGDDYAARVYVAFDIPNDRLSGGTKFKLGIARRVFGTALPDAALNYVWDNRHPVGTRAPSAYTDRAQIVVAETGVDRAGRWVEERADVAADFARAFGGVPGTAIQLAVAVDTDNTRSAARGMFADLHFVAKGRPCAF